MSPIATTTESKPYWRSITDLADSPELRTIVENEFPSRMDQLVDPLNRRRFVQLMGASLGLAGLSGCDFIRWPKEKILPFANRPEDRHPGTPVFYASAMELGGVGLGLLVKSYDGRPIKIEGNPQHPDSQGATDAFAQANVLSLYDPDRSKDVAKKGSEEPSTWDAFVAALTPRFAELRANKGKKFCILAEASSSPTLAALRAELETSCPQHHWYEWEALSRTNELEGANIALGKPYRTHLDLKKAKIVVSLGADLLGADANALRHNRDFAEARRPVGSERSISRLYVVESTHSLTGGMADERLAIPTSQIERFGLALAAAILKEKGISPDPALAAQLKNFAGGAHSALCARMAKDLASQPSLVAVGRSQPARLHAVGHMINAMLKNVGEAVIYTEEPEHGKGLAELVADMNASEKVDTLLILGTNPVLTAPADLGFEQALARVPLSIHLGLYNDETGNQCSWHIPRAHALEAWGDTRGFDGTISLIQPLIQPFYSGKTPLELLALALGRDPKKANESHPYNLVRAAHKGTRSGVEMENFWRRALHDGVVAGSAFKAVTPTHNATAVVDALKAVPERKSPATPSSMEITFLQDTKVYDGRFANNGWLQELPDPMTKITWDNAALLSPTTAEALGGLKSSEVLTIKVGGASVEIPAYVLPGVADHTISLALGYGRQKAGIVAAGSGVDVYPLRTQAGMGFATATVSKTGRTERLATTQDHHLLDVVMLNEEKERRSAFLIREATSEQYRKNPHFAKDVWDGGEVGAGPDPSTTMLWNEPQKFEGHKWAMAIDLNVCTGCSGCVVACQAENNIPVVGKSEVNRGREMHWLRIDRYFSDRPLGEFGKLDVKKNLLGQMPDTSIPKAPLRVVHQPMPCQQCENAPCESVCPVGATSHSREGLNDMAYNRCVGTRYCSNNCPYKVRRFNYFFNHHGPFHPRSEPGHAEMPKLPKSFITDALKLPSAAALDKVEQMVMNPDVTVRSRGVMEKCTYCVQRIKSVTIPARNEKRSVKDGEIRPACAQSCPTQAITFGDLNDPESRVSKLHGDDRTYGILTELNTRPRTKYMARLRNPSVEA
jgi:MoCo/4Fe-4S cofactor protein with predicted Tat translocation signal